jgi:GNAT superfamily N-acetyltransferase
MAIGVAVRRASLKDASAVEHLLSEWLGHAIVHGRRASIRRAVENNELQVAQIRARVIGFIHYVMHEDIIDGGLNSFITALYVVPEQRRRGVGSLLLEEALADSLARGAVGVETSTTYAHARVLYERHHFKQTFGNIGEVFLELDVEEYLSGPLGMKR